VSAHEQLREWAAGDRPRVAATELLIRAGLAELSDPWVLYDSAWKTRALDFDAITDENTASRRAVDRHLLRIAASLGSGVAVDLREEISGLDHAETELVMIAIAHAAGFTEITSTIDDSDGTARIIPTPPLASWPD
jgi:hypothetical protein